MISSGSWVSITSGTASIFQNFLKRIAFHSITGNQANAHRFHSPNIADQSLITATEFDFRVYSYALFGSLSISIHGAATHGE
jgi:hypothetical protein